MLGTAVLSAQEPVHDSLPQETFYYFVKGDSLARKAIDLNEVIVFNKLKFRDRVQHRKYLILKRKTKKVFPYAKLASERLVVLNRRMAEINRKSHRNRYAKRVNKFLEEEFSAELKKLTRTEGQILIKLIHRQTGATAYELVKNLRSGWKAFWYNTTASAFDISLKKTFDPIYIEEDYWIEDILQRAFDSGALEKQPSALDFKYLELTNKWKNISPLPHAAH